MGATIPMRRVGQPKDIAEAVNFLASDESAFMTGQLLHVNGGMVFN
jgi:3-oxoacyl-[acyl-carrier protein] reductase